MDQSWEMRALTSKNNEEQARTKHLELGQGEEDGRREIQFIAGRV